MRVDSPIAAMIHRQRIRPFVERGDRLEAVVRGVQEGRGRARPGDNPADLHAARVVARFEWPPSDPPRTEVYAGGVLSWFLRERARDPATFVIRDLTEC